MKFRLTTLAVLAAVVALPAIASAAPMNNPDMSSGVAPAFPYPNVVIPRDDNGNAPVILFHAEHTYLANACPTVMQHPGSYSSVLDRFCQEYRG